jgi:phosphohistidine swiveling domain-containing protein
MITLSNIFSREKTLFYFTMWNDSDRLGYERFLGYEVKNNLFIVPHAGQKGSVWYSQNELDKIGELLQSKLLDQNFESEIIATLDTNWDKLKPYLVEGQKITSADELLSYYEALVIWWSAMNTVFGVPDMESAPEDFKQKILSYRTESEKYTERMNKVFIEFWNENVSQFKDLISVLRPEEAANIAKEKVSQEKIESIRERLEGCFMYNRKVYPLRDLEKTLEENGLTLEKVETDEVTEIKGRPAQQGKATGPVKIIRVKADTSKISQGDIMVTEMTNPDYVPYMKIAGAIVTDEGGATCHAAIASRELKVPCIVGTRVATKVLKDGDIVEVDADKGIVKIIK